MRKKGFTLVEMLGVMTLLAIIFALVYPNITNMLEKGKENEIKEYESNIFLAVEAYVNADDTASTKLSESNTVKICFKTLLNSGYLSSKLVDPKSGKTVVTNANNKAVVVTVATDKTYTYSFVDVVNCEESL